jgi:hypothetical protein
VPVPELSFGLEAFEVVPESVVDAEPDELLPVPSLESDEGEPEPPFAREPLELERSFFAQPEPLNTTAGVAKAFRSVPSAPQAGQKRGDSALMPWITSVVCPQLEQR